MFVGLTVSAFVANLNVSVNVGTFSVNLSVFFACPLHGARRFVIDTRGCVTYNQGLQADCEIVTKCNCMHRPIRVFTCSQTYNRYNYFWILMVTILDY
jgi:hypothetical protein